MMGPTTLTSGLAAEVPAPRTPGPQPDGSVILPNQWSLRPAGSQVGVGDFPAAIAMHPNGRHAVVLHCGHGPHELAVLDVVERKLLTQTRLEESFQGLAFSRDGGRLWVSGGAAETLLRFRFVDGTLVPDGSVALRDAKLRGIPCGIEVADADGTVYVANVWGHSISRIRFAADGAAPVVDELLLTDTSPAAGPAIPDSPEPSITKRADALLDKAIANAPYPWTCVADARRGRLYVSLWGQAAVAVIDTKEWSVVQRIAVEDHPNEMVMSPDGKTSPPTSLPEAPQIVSPQKGALNADARFEWQPVAEAASYTVEIARDADFVVDLTSTTVSATTLSWPTPLAKGKWFWRVTGVDAKGFSGAPSKVYAFTVAR